MPKKMPFECYVGELQNVVSYYARKHFYEDYDDAKQKMLIVCWDAYKRWNPKKDASLKTFAACRCNKHLINYIKTINRVKDRKFVSIDLVENLCFYVDESFEVLSVKLLLNKIEDVLYEKTKEGGVGERRALELFRMLRLGYSRRNVVNKWGCDGALAYLLFKKNIQNVVTKELCLV